VAFLALRERARGSGQGACDGIIELRTAAEMRVVLPSIRTFPIRKQCGGAVSTISGHVGRSAKCSRVRIVHLGMIVKIAGECQRFQNLAIGLELATAKLALLRR